MWNILIVWSMTLLVARCQYVAQQSLAPTTSSNGQEDSAGWDIRLSVPGEPGRDYPTLATIPKTSFSCAGKEAGYYADIETSCQVFRVCTIGATYGFQSFLCPNGTLFNQAVFVCDWWMNVDCQGSQKYYSSNNNKYSNLRLGSSLMNDIKKMLTYSMVNPYDKSNLNSNRYVMQVYSPPSSQPFANTGHVSNNLDQGLHSAQQLQVQDHQNTNSRLEENLFSGSTPNPQYVHSNNFITANGQLSQAQNGHQFQSGQFHNGQLSNSNVNREESSLLQRFGQQRNGQAFTSLAGQNTGQQHGHFTGELSSQFALPQNLQNQYNKAGVALTNYQNTERQISQVQTLQTPYSSEGNRNVNTQHTQTGHYTDGQFGVAQSGHSHALNQNRQYINTQNSHSGFSSNALYNNAASSQFQNAQRNSQNSQYTSTQGNQDVQGNRINNNSFQSGQYVNYPNVNHQYSDGIKTIQNNGGKQNELEITFTKQQYTYPSQYDKQYTYKISSDQTQNGLKAGQLQEAKQNLAFVYDFLNAAKSYENILNDQSRRLQLSTENVFGQQFQNIDAEDLNEISEKISQLTNAQYNNINSNDFQTANLVSTAQTTTDTENINRGVQNQFSNQIQNKQGFSPIRSGQLRQSDDANGDFYSPNIFNGNFGSSSKLQGNTNEVVQNKQFNRVSNTVAQNMNQQISRHSAFSQSSPHKGEPSDFHSNQNTPQNENLSRESAEVEILETGSPQTGAISGKLQVAPSTPSPQIVEFNTVDQTLNKDFNNNNGIGAQFHKQIVGTINHPVSDNNLITYKADKSFYVYKKFAGSSGDKLANSQQQFGQLRQADNNEVNSQPEINNNGKEYITTVQFIPSLSFQLDDENQHRDLINVLQNQGGSSSVDTSGVNNEARFGQLKNGPTNSVDYSVQHTTSNSQGGLQQYKNVPANLYAGPSSYSAPQGSVGRLEPQRAQLNVAPSPNSEFAPARLEDFEDTDQGYPKVTPAIPFSF